MLSALSSQQRTPQSTVRNQKECTPTAVEKGSAMLLNLGGSLVSSNAALYPLLPHAVSVSPERLVYSGRLRNRRRTRPSSAALGPRFLHPSGSFPDGVPSSLFTLQPRATPTTYPAPRPPSPSGSTEVESATAVATKPSVVEEVMEALDVRLVEETDLPDVSALLSEVRKHAFVYSSSNSTAVLSAMGVPAYSIARRTIVVRPTKANGSFHQQVHLFFVARPTKSILYVCQ